MQAFGIRQSWKELLVPARDITGVIWTLQRILPQGEKYFLDGGRKAGCFHRMGTPKGAACVIIAEGYATAATIHEATGLPVAVAFDAGNLLPVGQAIRTRSRIPILFAADDDWQRDGNPGLSKAVHAASVVRDARIVVPAFGADRADDATDFNDLAARFGLDEVRAQITQGIEQAIAK